MSDQIIALSFANNALDICRSCLILGYRCTGRSALLFT
jgi:hypothetical protein